MSELTVELRHARRSSAVTLDLSSRALTALPKELFAVKTLEVLSLANNQLSVLESSITDLFRLRELDLSNNSFLDLPEELSSLPKLKVLHVRGNPLRNRFTLLLTLNPDDVVDTLPQCFAAGSSQSPDWLKDSSALVANSKDLRATTSNRAKDNGSPSWLTEETKPEVKKEVEEVVPARLTTASGSRRQPQQAVVVEHEMKNGVLEVRLKDLEVGEQISQGGFSTIHQGKYMGMDVAIKKIFDPKITQESLEEFTNEATMLAKYRHPNIVLLLGCVNAPPSMCLVMEFAREGTLFDRVHRRKQPFDDEERRSIAKQVAQAVSYLHRHDVVHRDIKSHNVLLDQGRAKLCDFGLARHKVGAETQSRLNVGPMQFSGTPTYMAPELLQKKHYGEAVDVFAFGTLMFELYSGEIPFHGLEPPDIRERVLKDSSLKANIRPAILELSSSPNAVNRCRHSEASQRPSMSELANSPIW